MVKQLKPAVYSKERLPMATDPSQSLHQSSGMTYPLQSNSAPPELTLLNRDFKKLFFLSVFIVRLGK